MTEKRRLLAPVGWMLGPELIAQLGRILLPRRDPRVWMTVPSRTVHDERWHCDGRLLNLDDLAAKPNEASEIWFDYAADMGDSSDAMYAIACACQLDLELKGAPAELASHATIGDLKKLALGPWRAADRKAANETVGGRARGNVPRGQFLFIGGDTAYHVADEVTIKARVQNPFKWAGEDLKGDIAPAGLNGAKGRLYGIPGNHDWYDSLQGFERIFQSRPGNSSTMESDAIELDGFEPKQSCSYVAIQLPHNWQLWGLDIDSALDPRQKHYFLGLRNLLDDKTSPVDPSRLVLCTPSPPIAFGKLALHEFHASSLASLRLTAAYSNPSSLRESCRLDLSGDVHHYARYQKTNGKMTPHYAAVVSGLGGAFHHPTFTKASAKYDADNTLYPPSRVSLKAISERLLSWRTFVVGSWIRTLSFLFTLFLGVALIGQSVVGGVLRVIVEWARATASAGEVVDSPSVPLASLIPTVGRLALFGSGAFLTWLAVKLFKFTYDAQTKDESVKANVFEVIRSLNQKGTSILSILSPRRSYWPTTALAATAIFGAFVLPHILWPNTQPTTTDLIAVALLIGGPAGGAIAGVRVGAKHLGGPNKLGIGFLGCVHGAVQVLTPLVCAAFAIQLVNAFTTAALGTAVGLVLITWVMLHLSRFPFRWSMVGLVAVIAFVAWVIGMFALLHSLPSPVDEVSLDVHSLARLSIGGLVNICLSTSYFAWYLAIAGLMNGHNNEVGGASRVTGFRQFIRFHLNADRLRGYVIAIEDGENRPDQRPKAGRPPTNVESLRKRIRRQIWGVSPVHQQVDLKYKLVDVFEIRPSPSERGDQ